MVTQIVDLQEPSANTLKVNIYIHVTKSLEDDFNCSLNVATLCKWWCLCSLCPELTYKVRAAARICLQQIILLVGPINAFILHPIYAEHVLCECENGAEWI